MGAAYQNNVDQLLRPGVLWRARGESGFQYVQQQGLSTGYALLDEQLPGGGWPVGAVSEIICTQEGIGEMQFLMPALAKLSQQGKWLALVAPPYIPYPLALSACGVDISKILLIRPRKENDALWTIEQALRAGTCGAVLGWLGDDVTAQQMRRLQLAAEQGGSVGLFFRSAVSVQQNTNSALRLQIKRIAGRLSVDILKRRGRWPLGPVELDINRPDFEQENIQYS